MNHTVLPIVLAAGAAVVVGAILAAVLHRVSRTSPVWAVRLAPLVAVASVAAGVAAASATMLLDPEQVRVMALVLAVAAPIAAVFGVLSGRRVAAIQQESARHEAARQRDRAVEDRRRELIAWLSHDLRTPLARLRALAEAQQDGLAPPDSSSRILREVDGLAVIIEDIATLSRLQSPTGGLSMELIDVSDLVSDAVAGNQPLADRLTVTMDARAPGPISVVADPGELLRALNNLIINALRHTRPEGFVEAAVASTAGDPGAVRISVRDQCGGIPESDLPHVFDVGWRGTAARTPGDAGAGLGLAIAARVVEAHHGDLSVQNTPDGCEFTIRLPRAPARPLPDEGYRP